MGIKYLYKVNPKVAASIGLDSFDRYHWPDGTLLLWQSDMIAIDEKRFFLDRENLLADLGAVQMTDPQAKAEQENPTIRLPEARLPQFRWEQPDFSQNAAAAEEMDIEEAAEELAEEIEEAIEKAEEVLEDDEEGGGQ